MKKNLKNLLLLIAFSVSSVVAFSQDKKASGKAVPKWVPEGGYWVVVSNIKTPETSEVYFYNNANTLIYSEKIEGMKLNLKKRKTCMRLKKVLDHSLVAYNMMQPNKEQLVKNIFGWR